MFNQYFYDFRLFSKINVIKPPIVLMGGFFMNKKILIIILFLSG